MAEALVARKDLQELAVERRVWSGDLSDQADDSVRTENEVFKVPAASGRRQKGERKVTGVGCSAQFRRKNLRLAPKII